MQLEDLDSLIKQLKREAKLEPDLKSKLDKSRELKEVESEHSKKRRELYEAHDQINEEEKFISSVEARLEQNNNS
jgi:hypothetical protein